jgi:hypothetical protein
MSDAFPTYQCSRQPGEGKIEVFQDFINPSHDWIDPITSHSVASLKQDNRGQRVFPMPFSKDRVHIQVHPPTQVQYKCIAELKTHRAF